MSTIERFASWLHDVPQEIEGWVERVLETIMFAPIITLLISIPIADRMIAWGTNPHMMQASWMWVWSPMELVFQGGDFISCLAEELIFRVWELGLAVWVLRRCKASQIMTSGALLVIITVTAIIFGYMHGGYLHIALKGPAGAVYALVFLKCGGIRGHWMLGCSCASAVHFLVDYIIDWRIAVALGG